MQKGGTSVSRGLLARVSRLLRRPLFGTFVVRKDARVDPTLFSEEEFPVFCPKCRYALRGLRDGLCPECGRAFERGLLLVRQYVFEWGEPLWRRTRFGRVTRWCITGMVICVSIPFLAFVGICLATLLILATRGFPTPQEEAVLEQTFWFVWACVPFQLVGLVLMGALCGFRLRRYAGKRRAVIAAIRAAASADEAGSDE